MGRASLTGGEADHQRLDDCDDGKHAADRAEGGLLDSVGSIRSGDTGLCLVAWLSVIDVSAPTAVSPARTSLHSLSRRRIKPSHVGDLVSHAG
jgi:hypothetical protein